MALVTLAAFADVIGAESHSSPSTHVDGACSAYLSPLCMLMSSKCGPNAALPVSAAPAHQYSAVQAVGFVSFVVSATRSP